jgi:hypothetical protein
MNKMNMQGFSFKCKVEDVGNAMELVKTIEKGTALFRDGIQDIDWYCQFISLMKQSAERLGVRFSFGNPKISDEIL